MGFNEGLPSRFPITFTFPDYSDKELLKIFTDIIAWHACALCIGPCCCSLSPLTFVQCITP